jgi:hypothetical protein
MLKYLRIAVTALSLMACVLLIALWVRSYQQTGVWHWGRHGAIVAYGKIIIDESWRPAPPSRASSQSRDSRDSRDSRVEPRDCFTTRVNYEPVGTGVYLPFWLFTALALSVSIVPWLPRRFSLRTLFIATTLVAAILGVIAASM